MNLQIHYNLDLAIRAVQEHLIHEGAPVRTETWQAMENPPEFYEALNVSFSALMPHSEETLIHQVKPNMPWARDHFEERVGGEPLNPGEQYKNWPFYKNNPRNDTSRNSKGIFSHTYMERIWPKYAGMDDQSGGVNMGIRFGYGDLDSLIGLLGREPHTRQAYLPIWFPEDTGAELRQRVPCTLGYHFIMRDDQLHVNYYIRSCDYFRHFRDDIYLCVKMVYWLLQRLYALDDGWKLVKPGIFSMHITSLHIFSKEFNLLKNNIWV